MSNEFHSSDFINTLWTPQRGGKIKCIAFDFDKTVTRTHTGGAVQLPAKCTDEFIEKNFSDLEFFRFVVPFIKAQQVEVAIASFGEAEDDAILSGIPLIRKYLDMAFGAEKSKDMIPDDMIALWHPESGAPIEPGYGAPRGRPTDPKTIGKSAHIDFIIKAMAKNGKKCAKGNVALFDDDEHNIVVGKKAGYQCHFCPTVSTKDTTSDTGFNREIWKEFIKVKGVVNAGCCLIM